MNPFALSASLAVVATCSLAAQSLIRDIRPADGSVPSSSPQRFAELNGIVYFTATDDHGRELWRSDGTAGGTFRVIDLDPGAIGSIPEQSTVVGNRLFFVATAAGVGRALSDPRQFAFVAGRFVFAATVPGFGREPWASDGTTAGTPPGSLCFVNVGFGASSVDVFDCRLLVQLPLIGLGSSISDAGGRAVVLFPIPNDPGLVGVALLSQFVVLDSGATLLGIASLSDGLTVLIGN